MPCPSWASRNFSLKVCKCHIMIFKCLFIQKKKISTLYNILFDCCTIYDGGKNSTCKNTKYTFFILYVIYNLYIYYIQNYALYNIMNFLLFYFCPVSNARFYILFFRTNRIFKMIFTHNIII